MHAVYNYCGFVDIYEALNKAEGIGPASRTLQGRAAPTTDSCTRDSRSSRCTPVKADKR